MKDVGIDQDQFNVGQQMLSLGIGRSSKRRDEYRVLHDTNDDSPF